MTGDSRKQDSVVSTEPGVQVASPKIGRRKVLSNISRKIWGDDPRKRKYVRKLDTFLLCASLFTSFDYVVIDFENSSYVLLGYFIKYLDQNNYSNAFVSGMQEELHLYGNERNLLTTYFNIGIILGTIPAQMIQFKYVRPSIWIPACELGWSALTMVMASAKNVETLYALRFFIGLIDGYLQAGLYTGMNGTAGLSGWRWLFIMDGVILIPIALYGFFALPDLPHNTRAFYLTKELWAVILPYLMVAEAGFGTGYFNLYLKSEGYSVVQTNILPTIGTSNTAESTTSTQCMLTGVLLSENPTQIVAAFTVGWLSDATGSRVLTVVFVQALVLVSNITLSIWSVPKAALLAAFYLSYISPTLSVLGCPILILFELLAVAGIYLLDYLYKRDLYVKSREVFHEVSLEESRQPSRKRSAQLYEAEFQSENDQLASEEANDDGLGSGRTAFQSPYETVASVETPLRAN
ncbi:pantothenate transporter [Colletotrichum salicis]|uniref:Pantothenate transporter n=1 Tax=Colletotrichum salicis TaxID=1209931 RepID=A0A135V8R9_9PEZI|nr:pantothenate transporter [Colletotrichum salicis]